MKSKQWLKRLAGLVCCSAMIFSVGCGAAGEAGPQGPQGEQGVQGEHGLPGLTPSIGENGNWWIGDKDTGIFAGNSNTPPEEVLEEIKEMEVAATGKQVGFVKNVKY